MSPQTAKVWARRVVDAAGLGAGQVFLDVGGGDGALCAAIESLSGATGCVLEAEEPTVPAKGHRLSGSAEELPLADATFDAVVLSHLLHHLAAPERAVSEALRVLRPGGCLVVRTASHADIKSQAAYTPGSPVFDHILDVTPDVPAIERWISGSGGRDVCTRRVSTENETPFGDWLSGTVLLAAVAWAAGGMAGDDPRPEIEARLRREYARVPDTLETLITARKP